jgi:hypothetical protein
MSNSVTTSYDLSGNNMMVNNIPYFMNHINNDFNETTIHEIYLDSSNNNVLANNSINSEYNVSDLNHVFEQMEMNIPTVTEINSIHLTTVLFGSDIYISTASEFGKQILRKNTELLKISLTNEVDDEKELSKYLYGKRYILTCGGCLMYEGILNNFNIFPTRHIPLDKVASQTIALIIYDVIENDIINDNSIKLKFTLNVSNVNHSLEGIEIQWGITEINDVIIQNKLRIYNGLCAQLYSGSMGFSTKCLKKSVNIKLSNRINLTKINNDISHFTNNYHIGRGVMTVESNGIIMETIIFRDITWNHCKEFCIPQCDTITNICIIMHYGEKLLQGRLNDIELKFNKHDNIYKVENFDNFNHCSIASTHSSPKLYLIFNTVIAKISIQYDRCVAGGSIRHSIAFGKPDEISLINLNSIQLH